VRPTARAVAVLVAGLAVALLPAAGVPRAWPALVLFWGAAALVLLTDAVALPAATRVTVAVDVPETMALGERGEILARVVVGGRRATVASRLDHDLILRTLPSVPRATTSGAAELRFPLEALRRGRGSVARVWVSIGSPLGLWSRIVVRSVDREVTVLPSVSAVRQAALRFFADRSFRAGLKIERYTGDGTEFDSLKDFVPGDDRRAVDWKASARHRELVCRQFRAERNHQLVIAIDTGRLMSEEVAGIPKVDHAIRAALLLAWAGLASGDRVGLFTFDARVGIRLQPVAGRASMSTLVRALAGARYSDDETNYTLGLTALGQATRRRSLIVLLTDFVDTIGAELMIDNLARVGRRHLVVFVSVRDPLLDGIEAAAPDSVHALHRAVVARSLLVDREVIHRRLSRLGIHPLDADPDRIGPELVNRYLDIKRRELV
jgi:uncharacterized protein (DUF58 family)